jgi:glycine/D-amino acid oxidase-like deaminating enzyme
MGPILIHPAELSPLAISIPRRTQYRSPWFSPQTLQIFPALDRRQTTEVLVVGGGIAGVSTAHFILTRTNKSCILAESNLIASGATGNNAGQAINGFEIGLAALRDTLGDVGARHAYEAGQEGYHLLREIMADYKIQCDYCETPTITVFRDPVDLFAGVERQSQLAGLLGLDFRLHVLRRFIPLLPVAVQRTVLPMTKGQWREILGPSTEGVALNYYFPSALLDTARLTRSLALGMCQRYSDRFKIFEMSPISGIDRSGDHFNARARDQNISAQTLIIATNGYTNPSLNLNPLKDVAPIVQLMLGFASQRPRPSVAMGFRVKRKKIEYFYSTTRPFQDSSYLTVIGGPGGLPQAGPLERFPEILSHDLSDLLQHSGQLGVDRRSRVPRYFWTGLLGYTSNGLRKIGPAPEDPNILYNTGCNGIGILLSVFGGKMLADHLAGKPCSALFSPSAYRPGNSDWFLC